MFFIKNYSVLEGVAEQLEQMGLVTIVGRAEFGPFDANAFLVELNR